MTGDLHIVSIRRDQRMELTGATGRWRRSVGPVGRPVTSGGPDEQHLGASSVAHGWMQR